MEFRGYSLRVTTCAGFSPCAEYAVAAVQLFVFVLFSFYLHGNGKRGTRVKVYSLSWMNLMGVSLWARNSEVDWRERETETDRD